MASDDDVREIASSSGYLFQMLIEHRIRQRYAGDRSPQAWHVLGHEYAWKDDTGTEGYIDLIAIQGTHVFVIEGVPFAAVPGHFFLQIEGLESSSLPVDFDCGIASPTA